MTYSFFFVSNRIFLHRTLRKKSCLHIKSSTNLLSETYKSFKKCTLKKCNLFISHLILKNRYTNLISKNTKFALFRKHFFDTLTLIVFLKCFQDKKKKISCLDIGTGSGFPGLLLSIIFDHSFFLLVESIQKKSIFHQKIIDFLFLHNSGAICSRIESIGKKTEFRGKFSFITARAVSEIRPLIQFSAPLLQKRGKFLIFKQTEKLNEEIKESLFFSSHNKKKVKGIFYVSNINKGRVVLAFHEENKIYESKKRIV